VQGRTRRGLPEALKSGETKGRHRLSYPDPQVKLAAYLEVLISENKNKGTAG
jgi:hypothetical protein